MDSDFAQLDRWQEEMFHGGPKGCRGYGWWPPSGTAGGPTPNPPFLV